jgi:hypothetical protein
MGFMVASGLQVLMKDLTLPASRNLFLPAFLRFPPADRSIDEPAKMSHPEFPGRAGLPGLGGTAVDFPAGEQPLHPLLHGLKKQHLPLDVPGNFSPPLLKTLHGPDRSSQEPGHFFLGFLQPPAKSREFSGVQGVSSLGEKIGGINFLLDSLYHIVIFGKTLFFKSRFSSEPFPKFFKN